MTQCSLIEIFRLLCTNRELLLSVIYCLQCAFVGTNSKCLYVREELADCAVWGKVGKWGLRVRKWKRGGQTTGGEGVDVVGVGGERIEIEKRSDKKFRMY